MILNNTTVQPNLALVTHLWSLHYTHLISFLTFLFDQTYNVWLWCKLLQSYFSHCVASWSWHAHNKPEGELKPHFYFHRTLDEVLLHQSNTTHTETKLVQPHTSPVRRCSVVTLAHLSLLYAKILWMQWCISSRHHDSQHHGPGFMSSSQVLRHHQFSLLAWTRLSRITQSILSSRHLKHLWASLSLFYSVSNRQQKNLIFYLTWCW